MLEANAKVLQRTGVLNLCTGCADLKKTQFFGTTKLQQVRTVLEVLILDFRNGHPFDAGGDASCVAFIDGERERLRNGNLTDCIARCGTHRTVARSARGGGSRVLLPLQSFKNEPPFRYIDDINSYLSDWRITNMLLGGTLLLWIAETALLGVLTTYCVDNYLLGLVSLLFGRFLEAVYVMGALTNYLSLFVDSTSKIDKEMQRFYSPYLLLPMSTSVVTLVMIAVMTKSLKFTMVILPGWSVLITMKVCLVLVETFTSPLWKASIVRAAWYHYRMGVQEQFPLWFSKLWCTRAAKIDEQLRSQFVIPQDVWDRCMSVAPVDEA